MKNFKVILYVLVIMVGLLQTIGYVTGTRTIRGLGMATTSSPLPIVFTQVKGVETFALDFNLQLLNVKGDTLNMHMDPSLYSKFEGPYNRRNVYGAAFAYGPVLPEHVRNAILEYAFCKNGKLVKEMGIKDSIQQASLMIKEKTQGRNRSWKFDIKCSE